MDIRTLNGKSICILGFGREGKAMLKALEKYAPEAEITISDQNTEIEINGKYRKQIGTGWLENLEKFNVIIKSPGIPPQKELEAVKKKITSSTQIFLDSIEKSCATVIGITGSKGKSTTASLLHTILKSAEKDSHLIGNIGEPAIAHIGDAKSETIFVQEMSSYQLMDLTVSPSIAVVTSFFPEHLDYHGSMEAYLEAKKHIARFQGGSDIIFFYSASEGARQIAKESAGEKIPFSEDDCPIRIEDTKLIGKHNTTNIAAAFLIASHLGISDDVSTEAIKKFTSLPHRLQPCGEHHGIQWVDDAISTTPESAIAALDALGNTVGTIILGGQDRGNDFSELADKIAHSDILTVILLGESGVRIRVILERASALTNIHEAKTMEEAVNLAKKNTAKEKICLLSPASPSYGMFKNFEERGEAFLNAILG